MISLREVPEMLALPIPDHRLIMVVATIVGWDHRLIMGVATIVGWLAVTGFVLLFLRRSRRRLHDRRALLRARLSG
jgi:hypothetical protein